MSDDKTNKELTLPQREELLSALEDRFAGNGRRHLDLKWSTVRDRLEKARPAVLWSLNEMERTGGEPDVVEYNGKSGELTFYDCAKQSPRGRRSLCYDREALEARKEHKPDNSAVDMAAEMGIDLLTEEQYRRLQELGEFDTTTSSWVVTPPAIRELGGAIFCDRRYNHIFTYHNGAESYYAARGFRGRLVV